MDFFSHGIWSGIAAHFVNLKFRKKFRVWLAVVWGLFPDFFAFAILFVWMILRRVFLDPPAIEPVARDGRFIFHLTSLLYNISHSAVVFLLVFIIVCALLRKPVLEMGAWLLHILTDIPTHSYKFYPTPFLWPVSRWKFNGFSWANPWFIFINYSLIAAALLALFFLRKKRSGR